MGRKITKWHLLIPFLGDYQRHVILADMERELGVPHQTLRKYAGPLVRGGILSEEQKPRNILYSINRENPMVLNYLSAAEKIVLEEALKKSTLLKRLYEMLSPCIGDVDILVFGSSAGGRAGEDIDLLAAGGKSIREEASRFGKTYGKKIHLIQARSFRPGRALFSEIMKKHLIFSGFDAFIKSFWESAWKS
jgi:predicted nucleotidyltransferase